MILFVAYKSPEYESMTFRLLVQRLVDIGYPKVQYVLSLMNLCYCTSVSCVSAENIELEDIQYIELHRYTKYACIEYINRLEYI